MIISNHTYEATYKSLFKLDNDAVLAPYSILIKYVIKIGISKWTAWSCPYRTGLFTRVISEIENQSTRRNPQWIGRMGAAVFVDPSKYSVGVVDTSL
jgi:hypothetical protein